MTREEIALRMFCAMLSRPESKVSITDGLGRQQIQISFEMANVFTEESEKNLGNLVERNQSSHGN